MLTRNVNFDILAHCAFEFDTPGLNNELSSTESSQKSQVVSILTRWQSCCKHRWDC